tara:strand:+ start:2376 stop:3398 length:1023 start_codon:yes stop_codon:yes gene_type:complete
MSKVNIYLFFQIVKYVTLVLFIFLSVAWLLQLTRLFTITNFMNIQIIDVIFLSFYLIPNLITVISPFILIFGLILCFIKLNKDNELIAILSLGLGLKPFKNTLYIFSLIFFLIFIILNLYLAPKIYEQYKIKEYDLRNTLDFNNIAFSNFLNLNKTTILDFDKKDNQYHDMLISYLDDKENIVYAKRGNILNKNNFYYFELSDGFKISVDDENEIENLEFKNYVLKIENKNKNNLEIIDKNTLTIFDDVNSKNYLNITFKIIDTILILFILIFFYLNNLKEIKFETKNNIFFIIFCVTILIINQIIKNSETLLINYISIITIILMISLIIFYIKKKYEKN